MQTLFVGTSDGSRTMEKRYSLSSSIRSIKDSMYLTLGADPQTVELVLVRQGTRERIPLTPDHKVLGDFNPMAYDLIEAVGGKQQSFIEDDGSVPAFQISEEQYLSRPDNARSFIHRVRTSRGSGEQQSQEIEQEVEGVKVGMRCEVRGDWRGVVQYVGSVQGKKGIWVGVELDEPLGKNDGSVGGIKYFEAKNKYGLFVPPEQIQVGDFPERLDEEDFEEISYIGLWWRSFVRSPHIVNKSNLPRIEYLSIIESYY